MSVKLVVTDLADLDLVDVRRRPSAGAKAVRMTHDFELDTPECGADGNAGEWVVFEGDGVFVLDDAAFRARYQRVLARKKPKAKAE